MRVSIVEAIKEWRDSRKNHGNERKRKERYMTRRMQDGRSGSDGGDCSNRRFGKLR